MSERNVEAPNHDQEPVEGIRPGLAFSGEFGERDAGDSGFVGEHGERTHERGASDRRDSTPDGPT